MLSNATVQQVATLELDIATILVFIVKPDAPGGLLCSHPSLVRPRDDAMYVAVLTKTKLAWEFYAFSKKGIHVAMVAMTT